MFVYTIGDVFALLCIALFLVLVAGMILLAALEGAWRRIRRAWATWFPANAPTWLTR